MLALESPSSDPPCPQQKPCDERASHERSLPVADLSKAAIVDEKSFSKFSIREYVLSSRSKSIQSNWPFSSKTLQLCLKHGMNDLLPPFQPLRSVAYTVENAKSESRSISHVDGKPAQLDHHGVLNTSKFAKSKEKQRQTCIESNICRFGGNGLNSPSKINSIPTIRSSNSTLDFHTAEPEAAEPPIFRKTERVAEPFSKKCRFSVKNGAQAYQASGEDIVSSSEAMASKTCPVCRTFSSPSNTTLNAHIDQCLSAESTPKWSLDSKSIKHKFKQRKIKLLVDIYTTALPCTLEDLDRRNGTTWAIASRPTSANEKSDVHCEGKSDSRFLGHPKTSDEGGVYFDARGTKLRILSAFNDELRSKLKDSLRSTRPEKEDEGKKFKLSKRKHYPASEHQKLCKFVVRRKYSSPQKDPTSQIEGDDGYNGLKDGCKDKHQMKSVKPHDFGCLKQWICSKRTRVARKITNEEDHPKFKRKWLVAEDLLVQSVQSQLDDTKSEKDSPRKPTNMTEEMECPLYHDQVLNDEGLIIYVNTNPFMKENIYNLENGKPSVGDGFPMKTPNFDGDSCNIMSEAYQAAVLVNTKKCYNSSEKMSSYSESLSKSGSKSPPVKNLEESKLEFDDREESMGLIRYNNAHESGEFHSETSLANSFDPMLIRGPPGSFLPSPGAMQSDEFQGNSSLTSSQVHSDKHDFTDEDSSDSPIFPTFAGSRFDFNYFALDQPNAFETKPSSVPSSRDLNYPQSQRLKNLSFSVLSDRDLNYPQPQRLTNLSFSADLNTRLKNFEIPPLCCCNRLEKAFELAPMGQLGEDVVRSISTSKDLGMKLPDCGSFESAISCSSNPVLRLMGKNLMVMSKNEVDTSREELTRPSSVRSASKDISFFHHRVHDDENSWNYPNRSFDVVRSHLDLKTSQTFLPRPEVLHPSIQRGNGWIQ